MVNVENLHNHVSIVSQKFDASIAKNMLTCAQDILITRATALARPASMLMLNMYELAGSGKPNGCARNAQMLSRPYRDCGDA